MPRKRNQPFDNPPSSKRQNLRPRCKSTKPEHTPSKVRDSAASKQQSLQQVKDEISSLIKYNSTSPRNFSANVVLTDAELSKFPLIELENYGILPSLLTKPNFDDVKNHLLTLLHDASDSVAHTNKSSLELLSDKFKLKNTVFSNQVYHLFNGKIKSELEFDDEATYEANVFGKLLKLVINGPGGRIEDYKSINDNDDLSFGTVIIQLPSFFTGGNIVVNHNEKREVYTVSETSNNPSCSLITYYSNCSVQQEEVISGYQTLMIYSLCWDGSGTKPTAYNEAPNVAKFRDALESLMFAHKKDYFVWGLDNKYKVPYTFQCKLENRKILVEILGTDKKKLDLIEKTLNLDEQRYGKSRYHLYVANATKTVSVEGVCGSKEKYVDYDYDSEYDNPNWCEFAYGRLDCGGNFNKVLSSEYVLESFRPLTGASLKSKYLQINVDAKKVGCVIDNYRDESFWGSEFIGAGGYDCSGPNSDNLASRTHSYERGVLVLWRADSAFEIKYNSGSYRKENCGLYHILQLLKAGQIDEAESGLETVWWPQIFENNRSQHGLWIKDLINVCCRLNKEDKLLLLFKEFSKTICDDICWKLSSVKMVKIVGKAIKKFSSDEMIEEFVNILKKFERGYVKEMLLLCNETQVIEPKKVIEILINFVFKDLKTTWRNNTYNYVLQLFEYMIVTDTYPDHDVNAAMEFVDSVKHAFYIISCLITKECTPIFNKIILRYVDLLVQEFPKPYNNRIFKIAVKMVKLLQQHQKKESIDVLLAKLLPTVDRAKDMMCMIEVHKSVNVEDRVVIKTLAARLTELVVA